MKQYLNEPRSRVTYFFIRIVLHLAAVAGLGYVFGNYFGPLESILESFPGLPFALFISYAAAVTISYMAFSFRLRFFSWALMLGAIGAAIAWSLWPSAENGLFQAFFFRYRLLFTVAVIALGGLNGIGFARWKPWTVIELCILALLLVAAASLTDRFVGDDKYWIVAFSVWYLFHALLAENAFMEYPEEKSERRLFLFRTVSKYVLNACFVALAFYFIGNFLPSLENNNSNVAGNSPYSNAGNPGSDKGKGEQQGESGGNSSHYVHELKPFVKLDPSISLGDKTLLYQIALKRDSYDRLAKKKGFPIYLVKYVLGALDDQSMTFQLEPNPALRRHNAFLDENYDWNAVEMREGSVIPLQTKNYESYLKRVAPSGLADFARRDTIDAVAYLSPFVKDDAIIAPDYPVWVRVLERKSLDELLAQLATVTGNLKKDEKLDDFELEKVISASYEFKALSYDRQLIWKLKQKDMDTAVQVFPEMKLESGEREYFLRTGSVSETLSAFTRKLIESAATPLGKARIIVDFFTAREKRLPGHGARFTYDLSPGKPAQPGQDYLDYFVLENRRGYCQYYAVATALMMRIAGVPSRVIAGYVGVERSDRNQGYFYVYASQAHAWTEIFLDGLGWIPLETTAPVDDSGFFDEENFQPPRRDPTPPDNPPAAQDEGVMTVIGRFAGTGENTLTLTPESYTVGAPAVLKDVYTKTGKTLREPYASNDVFFDKVGDIVNGAEPITVGLGGISGIFTVSTGKGGEREYEVVDPTDGTAPAEWKNLKDELVVVVGRFRNDEIIKEFKDLRNVVFTPDYMGSYLAPIPPPKPNFMMPILVIVVAATVLYGLLPVLITLSMYARSVMARDCVWRFKAAYEYVLYRAYLLGYRTRGRTRLDWARDLKEKSGFDFTGPTELLMRILYDPDCSQNEGIPDVKAFLREQSAELIRIFTYERVLASILNPFSALSWLYGRSRAEAKKSEGKEGSP